MVKNVGVVCLPTSRKEGVKLRAKKAERGRWTRVAKASSLDFVEKLQGLRTQKPVRVDDERDK